MLTNLTLGCFYGKLILNWPATASKYKLFRHQDFSISILSRSEVFNNAGTQLLSHFFAIFFNFSSIFTFIRHYWNGSRKPPETARPYGWIHPAGTAADLVAIRCRRWTPGTPPGHFQVRIGLRRTAGHCGNEFTKRCTAAMIAAEQPSNSHLRSIMHHAKPNPRSGTLHPWQP